MCCFPAHLNEDVNLIAVDWSVGAQIYTNALGNAPQVGQVIAQFINILINDFGYSPSRVKLVGVGLGAHIVGIAARNVNGDIPHIVGKLEIKITHLNNQKKTLLFIVCLHPCDTNILITLFFIPAIDPSFHGWTHHPEILNSNDANTVEVLHATAGRYGYDYPLGHIDFYPNGGSFQAGCGVDISCSHIYGYAFYAESINREFNGGDAFVGTACENYEEAVAEQCSGDRDVNFGGTDDKTG